MKENLRTILRCTGFAFVLVAALALLPANAQAQGHTTGFDIAKDCPIDPVDQGDTATCTFSLTNNDPTHGVESLTVTNQFPFPGGTTTPGVCLQGGVAVTVLGPAGTATDTCTGSFDEVAPITCEDTDTVVLQDEIRAAGLDCGAQCGVDDPPSDPFEGLPASGSTTNVIRVNPLVCPTAPECQIAQCTPGVGCGTINADDSTPCGTDTDGNECTSPGCAAGVCAQDHIPAADSTPCGTDLDQTDCGLPGCVAGVCTQGHNDVADSTPCGTDSDTTDCTTPGCVAGVCDQTHIDVADSTPCGTDSTPDDCTEPGCVAGVCDQGHIDVANSNPCGPDTDGLECTIPGCDGAGNCVQTHVDNCVVNEICRTPGFWGTHYDAGEKESAPDVTCGVLNAFNAANDPDLEICGTTINNCEAGNGNSALEAICVAVKGEPTRQLARQLMAAALNCIVSSSTGDPEADECPPDVPFDPSLTGAACSGISVEAVFNACNAACEAGDVTADDVDLGGAEPVDINCIELLDCFNNGFTIDPETGLCTGEPSGCHENELVGGCFDFQPPGPAGSPKECNEARKNTIDIVPGTTP